jgi:predicted alpha/beta-fold hydrolase
VVAIGPVIDPAATMRAMELGMRFYERYFERKWSLALRSKQGVFRLYAEEKWHDIRGLRERTHYLATRHAGFLSADEYFAGYSIAGERLAPLRVPSTLLTSADDPVVPVADFAGLPRNPAIELIISKYGGHCGFLKNWKFESIAEDLTAERFLDAAR